MYISKHTYLHNQIYVTVKLNAEKDIDSGTDGVASPYQECTVCQEFKEAETCNPR